MVRSFAYFGRLVPEKGFDLLFPFFDLVAHARVTASCAVFGDGPLMEAFLSSTPEAPLFFDCRKLSDEGCLARMEQREPGVYVFGFRSRAVIAKSLDSVDVSLMPSRFLETFGLSALESVSKGVPVIGFDKGGLSQFFADPAFALAEDSDAMAVRTKLVWASGLSDDRILDASKKAESLASKYSEVEFLRKLRGFLPEHAKKILLVTDFEGRIWGIETYVESLSRTLSNAGYEVALHSKRVEWNAFGKVIATLASFCNVWEYGRLRSKTAHFSPDVVWCHSVLRRIGPVGILPLRRTRAFRIMTYHDLGYFAPFASACQSESDVPSGGISAYLKSVRTSVLRSVYALVKYAKVSAIFSTLKLFDLHLVPSSFMERFVLAKVGHGTKVETLSHYVTE